MRWKISRRHGHDPRQIDLLALIALLTTIVVAYLFFADYVATRQRTATASFIVPSQSVRW
jgi:hypothetical protein